MSNKFIDYSQWKEYFFCQLSWYEKYRLFTRKAITGQQSDVMTLGSLVHAGLQHYRETGQASIPETAISEYNPTPECMAWGLELLLGWVRNYSSEDFTRYYCEQPLRFPLHPEMDGLAKVDSYMRLTEPRTIESGLGDSFTLQPGIWIHEYKTKGADKDVGKYISAWRMNMQANFQMLALQATLGEPVQGMLVNVLEKPKEYQPKRTCKTCKAINELRNWEPTGNGYSCPGCSAIQDLDTTDKSKVKRIPSYYRIMVTRTANELATAKEEIYQVAEDMLAIDAGKRQPSRSLEDCAETKWYRACDFFGPHSAGQAALSYGNDFVKIDTLRYVTL